MAKFETTSYEEFVAEATKRGLQILEGDYSKGEPVYVGIRQYAPQSEEHVDIEFGIFLVVDGEKPEGMIFDTDDEYEDWAQSVIKDFFKGSNHYHSPGHE